MSMGEKNSAEIQLAFEPREKDDSSSSAQARHRRSVALLRGTDDSACFRLRRPFAARKHRPEPHRNASVPKLFHSSRNDGQSLSVNTLCRVESHRKQGDDHAGKFVSTAIGRCSGRQSA